MKYILFFLTGILFIGCSSRNLGFEAKDVQITTGTWLVYEGVLACADCGEIKTHLEIFIDYSNPEPPFILKEAYIGSKDEDKTSVTHGIYGTLKETYKNNDATVYELNPDKPNTKRYFLRVNDDTLKMLDRNIKEIKSDLNYTLVRIATLKDR